MAYFKNGSFVENINVVTSSGSTLELSSSSSQLQRITGSTNHSVKLPDATTMVIGQKFEIINLSTSYVDLLNFNNSLFRRILSNSVLNLILIDNSTTLGSWVYNAGDESIVVSNSNHTYLTSTTLKGQLDQADSSLNSINDLTMKSLSSFSGGLIYFGDSIESSSSAERDSASRLTVSSSSTVVFPGEYIWDLYGGFPAIPTFTDTSATTVAYTYSMGNGKFLTFWHSFF